MANFNYQAVADTVAQNNTDRQEAQAAGTFLSSALQVYRQHLLDTQADQINATQNAPKATAVTDANGNPVFGDGTSASDPPTTADEQATDADLGYNFNENPSVPGAGGVAGLQMRMALQRQNTNSLLTQNRIQNLQSQIANRNSDDPVADAIQRARLAKLTAQNGTNAAAAITPGQQGIQNRFDTRQAYLQRQSDLTNQDKWFKQNTGVGAEAWGNWTNPRLVDGQGNQSDTGTFFTADAPDGKGGQTTIRIPTATYQQGQQKLAQYNALKAAPITPYAASPASASAPASAPAASASTGSSADDQAFAWASANPNDSRSVQILQRLNAQ